MYYTKLDSTGKDLPITATSWAMVRDNVTGLTWENKTNEGSIHDKDNTYTWADASSVFIKKLNGDKFGGYSDWRLPTITELDSIMDFSVSYPGPTINTNYFKDTLSSFYWSSSTRASDIASAWGLYFEGSYGRGVGQDLKNDANYVRAVRGGQSDIGSLNNLVINGDGTVTDIVTGLMWQQDTAETSTGSRAMVWKDALLYCENLALGGYTDWRLPTVKELNSIVDYSRYSPAININAFFLRTFSSKYWSSSSQFHGGFHRQVLVDFDNGGNSSYYGRNDYNYNYNYVRAVRSGKSDIGLVIAVSPTSRSVTNTSGTTTFVVSNKGTGTMAWNAAVTSGIDWLSITSGSSGNNFGTITCNYTANTTTSSRTGTIRINATGATGSPVNIAVTQDGDDNLPDPDQISELYYDDGISDGSTSPWSDQYGSEIAVRFDAKSYPVKLNKIRFYVTNTQEPSTKFGVYIYDTDNGSYPGTRLDDGSIYGQAATGNEWIDIDVADKNIELQRSFFVSMYWITAPGSTGSHAQFLGYDTTSNAGRTFWKHGYNGNWYSPSSSYPGNSMIRAEVSAGNRCILIGSNLNLDIACAEYNGSNYSFSFNYTNALNWDLDLNSFSLLEARQDNCLHLGNDLSLEIPCVEYEGQKLGFSLKYIDGLKWNLDLDSLVVK